MSHRLDAKNYRVVQRRDAGRAKRPFWALWRAANT